MPLNSEQEWILAACGLLAHADGVLTSAEVDHMVGLLGDDLGLNERGEWVRLLGDHEALAARFAALPRPMAGFAEAMLEKSWTMVLIDGDPGDPEVRVLEQIAGGVGIDRDELADLRARWSSRLAGFAEHVAGFASLLIHHDGVVEPAEADLFARIVARLPVAASRRDALTRQLLAAPPAPDELGARLMALPRERRLTVLRVLAPLVSASSRADLGREFFRALAHDAAISADHADHLLATA